MSRTPRDHFVPKAYLRGFTREYLTDERGGELFVYRSGNRIAKRLGINDYVACEPEFYDNHPIDKHWSQTIEQRWPKVRSALKEKDLSSEILDDLFWFVAAQFIRTHRVMDQIARHLSLKAAKRKRVMLDGREVDGLFVGMADTGEVMEYVAEAWPQGRLILEQDYSWTVHHNDRAFLFLTSDDPCQWVLSTEAVIMPLALDMALVGEIIQPGERRDFRHTHARLEAIRRINRVTVQGCKSFVYSHEETPEIGRFIERNHVERDVTLGGRGFDNIGKSMTDEEIERIMRHFTALRERERNAQKV
ncbi:MAG TPA: DUF4238 domain-containing protein [Chthoniobacteraceae bacterium]|jgi:hypothetical protein|nr:DUF4238 domain-containing protein [Chthoniobacteraceae bacterium]